MLQKGSLFMATGPHFLVDVMPHQLEMAVSALTVEESEPRVPCEPAE